MLLVSHKKRKASCGLTNVTTALSKTPMLNIAYKAFMTWSLPVPPKQTRKMYRMSDGGKFYGETTTTKDRARDVAVLVAAVCYLNNVAKKGLPGSVTVEA